MSKNSTNAGVLGLELPFKKPQNLDEVESNIAYLESELDDSNDTPNTFVWVAFIVIPIVFTILRFRGLVFFPPWVYILMWMGMISGGYMFTGNGEDKIEKKLYKGELKRFRAIRRRFLVNNTTPKPTNYVNAPLQKEISQHPFVTSDMMNELLEQPAEEGLKKLVESDIKTFEHRYQNLQNTFDGNMKFVYLLASMGFVFMCGGVVLALNSPTALTTYLALAIAGAVEGLAGFLFFWYHKRATKERENYQNGLAKMQKILLYFKLSQSADNELDKKMMMQRMIDYVIDDDFFDKY